MTARVVSLDARRREPEARRLLLCIQAEVDAGLETGQCTEAVANIGEMLASYATKR